MRWGLAGATFGDGRAGARASSLRVNEGEPGRGCPVGDRAEGRGARVLRRAAGRRRRCARARLRCRSGRGRGARRGGRESTPSRPGRLAECAADVSGLPRPRPRAEAIQRRSTHRSTAGQAGGRGPSAQARRRPRRLGAPRAATAPVRRRRRSRRGTSAHRRRLQLRFPVSDGGGVGNCRRRGSGRCRRDARRATVHRRAVSGARRDDRSYRSAASHGCVRIDNDEIDWMANTSSPEHQPRSQAACSKPHVLCWVRARVLRASCCPARCEPSGVQGRIDVMNVDGESRRSVLNPHLNRPGSHMPTCTTCHAATIAAVESVSSIRGVGVAGALSLAEQERLLEPCARWGRGGPGGRSAREH